MDFSERPQQPTQRHPWERARFDFFSTIVEKALDPRPERVLDMGSGDGWFSERLSETLPHADFVCVDDAYDDLALEALNASTEGSLRFYSDEALVSGCFDMIMLLDVLEHVEHDRLFLNRLVRDRLQPGGWLLFSVPAWPSLFTSHDLKLSHYRRYRPSQAQKALKGAGLELIHRGGLFHSLLLPRALSSIAEKLRRSTRELREEHQLSWQHGPWLTRVIMGALQLDNSASHLFAKSGMPIPGLSWWALAQKPASGSPARRCTE